LAILGVPRERRAISIVGRIVREVRQHTEAISERRRQQARARRRADKREARQVDLECARRRSLPNHEVELEVLHRGVEDLFDGRAQAVNLVDEKHISGFEVRDNRRQIACPLDDRARGGAQRRPHVVRDHMRESGLPEAGWPVEQCVIQTLAPLSSGLNEDAQVLANPILAHELVERLRAQPVLETPLELETFPREELTGLRHAGTP
jgi:hypothetical protein